MTYKGPFSRHFRVLLMYGYLDESCFGRTESPSGRFNCFLERQGLSFDFTFLSLSSCALISRVLHRHSQTQVHRVKLTNCFMSDAGFAELVQWLKGQTAVSCLAIPGNDLTPLHMPDLCIFLTKSANTLTEVNLGSNKIGDDGLQIVSDGLQRCISLKTLWLEQTSLTFASGPTLGRIVSVLPQLNRVDVGRNSLGDSGVQDLIGELQACSRMAVLDISETQLSAEVVPALTGLIASLPLLCNLFLRGNNFDADGRSALQFAIDRHEFLRNSSVF